MPLDSARSSSGRLPSEASAVRPDTEANPPRAARATAREARSTSTRDVGGAAASDADAWGSPTGDASASAGGPASGSRARAWFSRQPLVRFLSANLLRRILASNLLGLSLLLGGILYLTQYQTWLIDAKQDALKTQGEIIAAAIAANAKVTRQEIELDPAKLPEAEGSLIPFRDDGFAALELSLRPEQVTPILRRLLQNTHVRARIYGRDAALIVDSARFLTPGQISRSDTRVGSEAKPKDFWTRLTQWLLDGDLPVYKEIGSGKGTAYKEITAALKGAPPAPMLLLNDDGDQIVAVPVPIQRAKKVHGVLLLSSQPGDIDGILDEQRKVILWLAAMALAATVITSVLLDRTVAGPMRRLSETALVVSRDINHRQDLPDYAERSDEVGQMARAFRSMTAALFRRIEASEKFAADVAHELKNPLTAARSTAESLEYARTDAQRAELVEQIQLELKRLNRLITDVSKASRLDAELARQHTEPVELAYVLDSVMSVMKERAGDRRCRLELSLSGVDTPEGSAASNPLADRLVVSGNDGRLAQVMTNLVDNAISFSPDGGVVRVTAARRGGTIEVRVDDDGPGIDETKLGKIFERFYTYRPTSNSSRGDNSGLGLSISREIVKAHGGEIRAENRYADAEAERRGERSGARFVVTLPAAEPLTSGRGSGARGAAIRGVTGFGRRM